jgi:hypothetical protein
MNVIEIERALRQLRLGGMAAVLETRLRQAQAEAMVPIDLIACLVGDELTRRSDRLLERRRKQAAFRDPDKTLDNFDFNFNPKMNRSLVFDLATAAFIAKREDALFLGPGGTGKSHLGQAIGQAAIQQGYRVMYRETHVLLDDLAEAVAEGTRKEFMESLTTVPLLIIESGYSIYTLRQASRRSWRIGQKQPVKVKFLAYAGTMQENCLRLMGKKLLVSLAMEGKFANYGLQALDDDDDMLTAMARELVTQKGVGERADALWRDVQRQYSGMVESARAVTIEQPAREPVVVLPSEADPAYSSEPKPTPDALIELVLPRPRAARRPHPDSDAQLSLAF